MQMLNRRSGTIAVNGTAPTAVIGGTGTATRASSKRQYILGPAQASGFTTVNAGGDCPVDPGSDWVISRAVRAHPAAVRGRGLLEFAGR